MTRGKLRLLIKMVVQGSNSQLQGSEILYQLTFVKDFRHQPRAARHNQTVLFVVPAVHLKLLQGSLSPVWHSR